MATANTKKRSTKKNFKYIIMCGGEYKQWEIPRQMAKVNGEEIVARTIRLLKENGIKDINISSNNPIFEKFGVPVLKHNNPYTVNDFRNVEGDWFDAFYPTDEPTCYLFGDVVFSPKAIKTIIDTKVTDMEFFGSMKPFAECYVKTHEEPFALKVVNTDHLKKSIEKARELNKQNKFWRRPIMWELWTVIKGAPLQTKRDEYTTDYIAINDYTCDVDKIGDNVLIEKAINDIGTSFKVKVIIDTFTYKDFDKLKNVKRINGDRNEKGHLYLGDTFECSKSIADYLLGDNNLKKCVIEVIEIIPIEKDQ